MSQAPTADLALRTTVRELVAAFVAAEADVRAAFGRIIAAERALNAVFGDTGRFPAIHVSASGNHWRDDFSEPDRAIALMSLAAWRCIVERLELKRFMSIKRWDQLQNDLEKGQLPAITEENVTAFARGHLAQARTMLKEAVDEVFEWLRPRKGTRTGDLKTNSELEVPEKVILGGIVERGWERGKFRVSFSYSSPRLIALENVFKALDGQGEICKGHQSLLQTAIETAKGGEGETALFRFRCCLNGHLHLWFKRPDLLTRFNQLAGGARLRPAEEEVRLRAEIAKVRAENERLRARASG